MIAQRPHENENDYADRIAAAARHCANVFEYHALVHYYVRGLLATTRERVTEDLRRLPEKERNDLTAIRQLATAQGNTYPAHVQAAENMKAHTRAKPRNQTLYVAPDPRETRDVTGTYSIYPDTNEWDFSRTYVTTIPNCPNVLWTDSNRSCTSKTPEIL